jgi:GTP-binding protein
MLVTIVGRPNVGKSTLFNRISRSKKALVDGEPGVTRDRNYAHAIYAGKHFSIVDTGGFEADSSDELFAKMREHTMVAVEESDLLLFLTDGREGLTPADREIYHLLQRSAKPVILVVNKIDGPEHEDLVHDFFALGADRLVSASADHGYGIRHLLDTVAALLPEETSPEEAQHGAIRLATVGRANVGKSSLINRILGEQRLLVSEKPGTTRDAIDTIITVQGRTYILTDTAGIRRKSKVSEKLEKYSILKALKGIEHCHLALVLMDALEAVTEQDVKIAGYAYERGRAVIFLINKWDLLPPGKRDLRTYREQINQRVKYLSFSPVLAISALTGKRVSEIFPVADELFRQFSATVSTPELNRLLFELTQKHAPPRYMNQAVTLKYITQISIMPPTFAIFTNRPEGIHFSYQRYLSNQIKEHFGLNLTPIKLVFKPKSGPHQKRKP